MNRIRSALLISCGSLLSAALLLPPQARAWGDEGHEIVGLIAEHFLEPGPKAKVEALLATDTTGLVTPTDIAHEATWADKFRDSDRNSTKVHYNQTNHWHYVDIELDGSADFDQACNNHPGVPAGTPASLAPPMDCVSDKINQFAIELATPSTSPNERLEALQFLLHFVGDTHQPLHASDDHDQGGNAKLVKGPGLPKSKLHSDWDTAFVKELGTDPNTVAADLIAQITPAQQQSWAQGTPRDWAQESFGLAKTDTYGKLPAPNADGTYTLDQAYIDDAKTIVAEQLSRAGVRLAMVLNKALSDPTPTPDHSQMSSLSVAQLIALAKPITNSYKGSPFVGQLQNGDIVTQSKLALDTDGSIYCKQDPDGQPDTSLKTAGNKSLDADSIPYIVMPGSASKILKGIKLGDIAVVLYGDKSLYAVIGDIGPKNQFGEASLAVFRALGEDRIDSSKPHGRYLSKACKHVTTNGTEGDLRNLGMGTKAVPVTMVLFPGTHEDIDKSSAEALKASVDRVGDNQWNGSIETFTTP